ncbi:MAG: flagellar hook-basal body complex protein [Lachnospiraceae bacterium]|nr:flagellar hook-basal body complex protein [Lachnospiraceae bacterium]
MMRSLFSGVSGLKTHQTKMDVIGNNIANVNTTAFKSSSVTFSALMSQTTQNASGPNATTGTGGINPRQIGLGVKSGAINTDISGQGSAQSTGNPFDIMISGDNFFIVSDGNSNFFTRDGSFYVDAAGNLAMTSIGYNVMGWQVDPETMEIKKDTVSALRIMSTENMTYPPESTTKAYFSGIIDKNDTDVTSSSGLIRNLNFYDNLGYSYTAKMTISNTKNAGVYALELDSIIDSAGNVLEIPDGILGDSTNLEKDVTLALSNGYSIDGSKKLTDTDSNVYDLSVLFETDGSLKTLATTATDAEKEAYDKAYKALAKAFGYEGSESDFYNLHMLYDDDNNASTADKDELVAYNIVSAARAAGYETTANYRKINGALIQFDTNTGKFYGINGSPTNSTVKLRLNADATGAVREAPLGGNFSDIDIDFSTVSMYDNKGTSTIGAKNGDTKGLGTGRRLGKMTQVSIQNNGMIYAAYDNGMTRLLGQIASAEFANASGLTKEGDNLYSASTNSGEFDGIGVDVTANGGYFSTGVLEMSNVDLSAEFTDMITTQRGFQANSRIITVSDTLLEELTNLKR